VKLIVTVELITKPQILVAVSVSVTLLPVVGKVNVGFNIAGLPTKVPAGADHNTD